MTSEYRRRSVQCEDVLHVTEYLKLMSDGEREKQDKETQPERANKQEWRSLFLHDVETEVVKLCTRSKGELGKVGLEEGGGWTSPGWEEERGIKEQERERAVLFLRGSHPDSVSGGPGECWREARAEHETDRKQIGPEPAAINHQCGARPLHSSRMHTTHTNTHTGGRKWIVATQVKSPAAAPMGIKGRKITLLTSFSSAFFLRSLPVSKPPCLLELHLPRITRGQRTDAHTKSGIKVVSGRDVCQRKY